MTAKLRTPWFTKRRHDPAPSVTVFLLEERSGMWHPVVERHSNCRGTDPHDSCVVMQRFVGPGTPSRSEAEEWLSCTEVTTAPRMTQ